MQVTNTEGLPGAPSTLGKVQENCRACHQSGVPKMTWTSLSLFAEQTGQRGKGRGRGRRQESCPKRDTVGGVGGGSMCARRPAQPSPGLHGNRWARDQGPAWIPRPPARESAVCSQLRLQLRLQHRPALQWAPRPPPRAQLAHHSSRKQQGQVLSPPGQGSSPGAVTE